jgi:Zn-finger nucleic acid-binding protein
VRLVACTGCHTQYDVSAVTAERFPCHCGTEVENRVHAAVDARIHRCGSCGALVGDDAASCDFCGSNIVREPGRLSLLCPECYARCPEDARFCTACGVEFRPQPVGAQGSSLPCPGCGALMPPHHVGGIRVHECTACRGVWAPGDAFDQLVERAFAARRAAQPTGPPAAARVSRGNPTAQGGVRYRKCPECQGLMQRRNFRKSSGVILDVCKAHGTWLDADELEQIAGFLLGGGQTSPTLVEEDERVRKELARLRVQREAETVRGPRGFRTGPSLLDTLIDLID